MALELNLSSLNSNKPRPTFQTANNVQNFEKAFCGNLMTNEQILVILPPRRLAPQKIRPLVYNFNNEFLNTMEQCFNSPTSTTLTKLNKNLSSAIMPSSHGGIDINTNMYSETWAFIMIVNIKNNGDMHSQRMLYAGTFLDEPINPLSGRPNPQAKMIFTTTSILTGNNSPVGSQRIQLQADNMIVDPHVLTRSTLGESGDMFFNLVGDIVDVTDSPTSTFGYPEEKIANLSRITLANMDKTANLPKAAVEPVSIVNDIGELIKTGLNQTSITDYVDCTNPHPIHTSGSDIFHRNSDEYMISHELINNLPSLSRNNNHFIRSGLDVSRGVMVFGDIIQSLPNLQIINAKDKTGQLSNVGDGMDQSLDSRQTVLSYLLSYAIEPIVSSSGISSIAFEYHSHVPNSSLFTGRKNPEWFIQRIIPMVEVDGQTLNAYIDRFKKYMEELVFSTIASSLGNSIGSSDFVCFCNYIHGVECKVQLKLLDYQSSCQQGFYKSYGFLLPLTAPTVGNSNVIGNNIQQVNKLKDIGSLIRR